MLDQPTDIRKGEELDTVVLEKYLKAQLPDLKGEMKIKQFPGGFSNLTYAIDFGEKQMVLRRPPFGANIKSGHDMSREHKILSRLGKVFPKVPLALLFCEDHDVLGADFYVMERVSGVIMRPKMPKGMEPDATKMKGIANALVDTFVELHQVDYETAGLGDLGRPNGYIERQVSGWTRRYFKAKTDEIPGIEMAAEWLAANMPEEGKPTLIHNDFKYDNVVLDPNNWTKVISILDWEMATLGDPLMDVGTSIGYWINHNDPDMMKQLGLSPTTLPGNPTRGEFLQMYAEKSGREIKNPLFYYIYGLFKIAVIVQQIYARYKKGYTQDQRFARLGMAVQGFGAVITQAIDKNRVDDLF